MVRLERLHRRRRSPSAYRVDDERSVPMAWRFHQRRPHRTSVATLSHAGDAWHPAIGGSVAGSAQGDAPSTRWLSAPGVCMKGACMPNVQIREVPEDVHEALVRKAELAGQSLQQYLSAQLVVIASTPTVDEVIDLIARRQKGSVSQASTIAALRDERARR